MNKISQLNDRSPFQWLILCFPFGIAIQSLASLLAYFKLRHLRQEYVNEVGKMFKIPLFVGALSVLWIFISSLLNPLTDNWESFQDLIGYVNWILLPFLALLAFPLLTPSSMNKIITTIKWACLIWGVIVISQKVIGWRIAGHILVADGSRPRGLYSHPLTLAYCSLIPWPLIFASLLKNPKDLLNWLAAFSLGLTLYVTLSRTVQATAFLVVVWSIMAHFRGPAKKKGLLLILFIFSSFFLLSNPAADKILETFEPEGTDRISGYQDDRIAFWYAHWAMIKERPLTGHGSGLDGKYREPYYRKIGLEAFSKKYEAHNTFLQMAANGGLISLTLFLFWLLWNIKSVISLPDGLEKQVCLQSLMVFFLSGLTQNSFQDSEFRYGLTLMIAVIWQLIFFHRKKLGDPI